MSTVSPKALPVEDNPDPSIPRHVVTSLLTVIAGTLVLRVAAQVMNQMLQFYFGAIDRVHHLSYETTGLVTASFFITELIGSPILGAWSDRKGRKLFVLLGPLFGAVAVQITSLTTVLWLIVITRLLEGLSTASSIPSTLGYISEATSGRPNLRARIVGMFEITFIGGVAIGSVIGGYLWDHFGTPVIHAGIHFKAPAFSLNAVIYLLSILIFAIGLREIRVKGGTPLEDFNSHHRLRHYIDVLESPKVLRFAPAWLAINSIVGAWVNYSPRLLTGGERYGAQGLMGHHAAGKFGKGFALFAVVFAIGVLAWSMFIGKRRKTSVMLVSTSGLLFILLSVYGLNHFRGHHNPTYYILIIVFIIGLLIISGFTPAALTYLADITESHNKDRGSIMGLYSVFFGIGQLLGITLGGFFAEWQGVDGILMLSGLFGVITFVTLFALRRRETQPDANALTERQPLKPL